MAVDLLLHGKIHVRYGAFLLQDIEDLNLQEPAQHQHDVGLSTGRCCKHWPPAGRVRTVGSVLNSGRLIQAATYTARLLATLAAVAAVHTLLLPATTARAGAHGITGWALWLIWAAGSLTALHHGVLARRRSPTAGCTPRRSPPRSWASPPLADGPKPHRHRRRRKRLADRHARDPPLSKKP